MPQSPHRLRNDLKCVEWDVKPYTTNQPDKKLRCFVLSDQFASQTGAGCSICDCIVADAGRCQDPAALLVEADWCWMQYV